MKFRATRIQVLEYDVNPENYGPPTLTPNQMLAIDFDNLRDDPWLFMDRSNTKATYKLETVEEPFLKIEKIQNG